MEVVVCSLGVHGSGGLFIGFFVEVVVRSLIFHGSGGLFIDVSWKWWFVR
jgi:hypothetical protein